MSHCEKAMAGMDVLLLPAVKYIQRYNGIKI